MKCEKAFHLFVEIAKRILCLNIFQLSANNSKMNLKKIFQLVCRARQMNPFMHDIKDLG